MNLLIKKYIEFYKNESGLPTEKIKKMIMQYSPTWQLCISDSCIADLLDDDKLTIEQLLVFFQNMKDMGNEDFKAAVVALQFMLEKKETPNQASLMLEKAKLAF